MFFLGANDVKYESRYPVNRTLGADLTRTRRNHAHREANCSNQNGRNRAHLHNGTRGLHQNHEAAPPNNVQVTVHELYLDAGQGSLHSGTYSNKCGGKCNWRLGPRGCPFFEGWTNSPAGLMILWCGPNVRTHRVLILCLCKPECLFAFLNLAISASEDLNASLLKSAPLNKKL